jgi:hypothetical protein
MGDVNGICEQRKQFQLYNIPPIRFEPISPYPAFTQDQLNMRRKTEILKYNKNSTQGPRLTQKQKLAATFRGGFNPARVVCPTDYKIPVLTSAAGVPGPPMYLVEDPDVPLYNYIKDTNAYAENLYEDNTQWVFSPNANQLCANNNKYIEVAKLIIRKPIQEAYTRFTYRTPVLFRMRGTGLAMNSAGGTITSTIDTTTLKFQVLYNATTIANNNVLTSCMLALKDHFNIERWNINQPIILSDITALLLKVNGVQTVTKVEIINKQGGNYSQYAYDINGATRQGNIYPSLDPSIFEIRFPDIDIQGRVVPFAI